MIHTQHFRHFGSVGIGFARNIIQDATPPSTGIRGAFADQDKRKDIRTVG